MIRAESSIRADVRLAGSLMFGASLNGAVLTPAGVMVGVIHQPGVAELDPYEGSYEVTPKEEAQVMYTAGKHMVENTTINAIPIFNVSNTAGGSTVYIGSIIE